MGDVEDVEDARGWKSAAPLPGNVPLSQMLPSSTTRFGEKFAPESKGETSGLSQTASRWKLRASLKARARESVGEVKGEPKEPKWLWGRGGELKYWSREGPDEDEAMDWRLRRVGSMVEGSP